MLAKICTQKQFMDELDRMNTHEGEDLEVGKPPDLKSYILETNKPLAKQYVINDTCISIEDTGLEHVKILVAKMETGPPAHYYLDRTDRRFLVLHTNDQVTITDPIIKKIITSDKHQFDSAWLHTDMLKLIAKSFGNRPLGYGVRYEDIFKTDDSPIDPRTDLKIDVSGAISGKILELIQGHSDIKPMIGYEKVFINRGTPHDGVLETLEYSGRFRLVRGNSIDEHMSLITHVTKMYRETVEAVENKRIRARGTQAGFSIEGNSFTFEFERDIEDWNRLLPKIFNSKEPFRIWGLRTDAGDGVQKILCVDMHTGDQLDVEVGDGMMRVFLPYPACGNVVLRLYTNLQRYLDANMKCTQLGA